MKTFLVDFENVKSKGLTGIEKLTHEDKVIIFYSENSDTISFEMHCMVMQAKAQIEYMKVRVGGKNALDFQLSTLLGYLVALETSSHIFVISGDKGFDKLHDFWTNTFADPPKCVVYRTPSIASAEHYLTYGFPKNSDLQFAPAKTVVFEPQQESHEENPEDEAFSKIRRRVLRLIDREQKPGDAEKIVSCVERAKTKIQLHTFLMQTVGMPIASTYYNNIKEDFFDMRKELCDEENTQADEPQEREERSYEPVKEFTASPLTVEEPDDEVESFEEEETDYSSQIADDILDEEYEAQGIDAEEVSDNEEVSDEVGGAEAEVRDILSGKASENEITAAEFEFSHSENLRKLYFNLVGQFKRKRGGEIYNLLKDEYCKVNGIENIKNAKTSEDGAPKKRGRKPKIKTEDNEQKPVPKKRGRPRKEKTEDNAQESKKKRNKRPEPPIKPLDEAEKQRVRTMLEGNATEDEINGVIEDFSNSSVPQKLYTRLMGRFGRDRGRQIYAVIKSEFAAFYEESENNTENV